MFDQSYPTIFFFRVREVEGEGGFEKRLKSGTNTGQENIMYIFFLPQYISATLTFGLCSQEHHICL